MLLLRGAEVIGRGESTIGLSFTAQSGGTDSPGVPQNFIQRLFSIAGFCYREESSWLIREKKSSVRANSSPYFRYTQSA